MSRRLLTVASSVLGVCAALAGCVLVVASWPGAAQTARAGLSPGRGYRLADGDFVGYYRAPGGPPVYCIDPDARAPVSAVLHRARRLPGGPGAAAQVEYALRRWGAAPSNDAAAVVSQVVNTLVGNHAAVRRRAAHLPARLAGRVASEIGQARRLAGPYTVHVDLTRAVLPGQTATGRVSVRSRAGQPLAGAAVQLVPSGNAALAAGTAASETTATAADGRTDRGGTLTFHYTATGVGPVRVAATVTGLTDHHVAVSRPATGVQRMVGAAAPVRATASATTVATPAAFDTQYACDSDCDGHPVTTVRACAEPSRLASRFLLSATEPGGTPFTAHTVDFAPAGTRTCRATTLVARDGERLVGAWQWRTPRGWTRTSPAKGSVVIDCPAVPAVHAEMSWDCTGVLVHVALATPTAGNEWAELTNRTSHRMVLEIGGDVRRRIVAAPGDGASFTATGSCTTSHSYTVRAGIERANHGWNYGPTARITTPSSGGATD